MRVVELFAGVGGFRVGLERIKGKPFEFVYANQWEPATKSQPAYECYIRRFGESDSHTNIDIAEVDAKDIPDHDLLVGGFPCQDYSVARTRSGEQGIQGKKGVLFWEIHRIAKEKQPKYMLLENVDRLLKSPSKQRGRDFSVMLATLRDLGYLVEWRVINAADYGFAQRRRRVFIFAYHKTTDYGKKILTFKEEPEQIVHEEGFFSDIFPIHKEFETKHTPKLVKLPQNILEVSNHFMSDYRNSGVLIGDIIYTEETDPVKEEPTTLGEILEKNVSEEFYLDDTVIRKNGKTELEQFEYLKGPKRIPRIAADGHEYIYSEGGMSFPDPLDKPGRTMLTGEATTNRSTHIVKDPQTGRLRKITPVEAERLNDFPDNWTEGMTTRQRYFMMGNALVTGLVTIMGEKILKI